MLGGFGFKRPAPAPAFNQHDVLVSKTDIYGPCGANREAVLLLKEGTEVPATLMPKFRKLGIDASQFDVVGAPAIETDPDQSPENPGITGPARRGIRNSQRVLVVESSHRDIERLTHCLVICGFNLGKIHPVRILTENNLKWALSKYNPHVAIVDYELGLERIVALAQNPPNRLEQLLVTLSLKETEKEPDIENRIAATCSQYDIGVLLKPVNRFALNKLLS